MNRSPVDQPLAGVLIVAAIAFLLWLYGAIPFVATPDLGIALWAAGFAHSLANNGLMPFAGDIGIPHPASVAFGLAGVWPTALLIKMGLHPADAYAAVFGLWLVIAFLGAWCFSIRLGSSRVAAPFVALVWMTMPVVFRHTGYSMLALGIALLPFYLLAAYDLFTPDPSQRPKWTLVLRYVVTTVIAVFMDGYSFIMFAAGSSIIGVYYYWRVNSNRKYIVRFAVPVHVVSFFLAYILFAAYIGRGQFERHSLDVFRGFGADLIFFVQPPQGVFWVWDALGLSAPRSGRDFFGDASTWLTTFLAPLLVVAAVAWWRSHRLSLFATGILIVGLFGLYMSLGPSLKINSTRPAEVIASGQFGAAMPAEYALGPTGSGVLAALPGLGTMRASYRWAALAVVSFWLLWATWAARARGAVQLAGVIALSALLVGLNYPSLRYPESRIDIRQNYLHLDRVLIDDMRTVLKPTELVAFLPWQNDFLVNYLAPALKIRTYNIGGDKNVGMAREYWPPVLSSFSAATVDDGFDGRVIRLLSQGEADAVVLPYINFLWAAHAWPLPLDGYPKELKEQLTPVVASLTGRSDVCVVERDYYAVVRLGGCPT